MKTNVYVPKHIHRLSCHYESHFSSSTSIVSRCERKIIATTGDKHSPINLPLIKENNACLMDKILLLKFVYVKPNIKSATGWGVLVRVGPAPYIGHVSQSIKKGSNYWIMCLPLQDHQRHLMLTTLPCCRPPARVAALGFLVKMNKKFGPCHANCNARHPFS